MAEPGAVINADDDILSEGVFDIDKAMTFIGIGRAALYKAMYRGDLISVRLPGLRSRRIPVKAAKEYLRRGLTGQIVITPEGSARVRKATETKRRRKAERAAAAASGK